MKLEEKIKRILKKHADDFGDIAVNDGEQVSEIIPELLVAIRSAGWGQLSKNQGAPQSPYPPDIFQDAMGKFGHKVFSNTVLDMLTPDANGEAFRRVKVPKEE